ncbi:rhamnogalacturonan acetylesterase [Mitsuaria sp. TWR114]|uniref:rhamnogalacturonan acetylesterase n=1 Tax=Mitsuaria sp. TWR114 TaxID=2601731 RepID=UPI0011BF4B2D|nr:rhamnogalacturonan acetylesterase [Mitsuaria sp. TWR114]TXD85886.1 rhamnogalacturonan acetylesterase [Mitsuaria sp. TWR114]TXD99682.1 rhamnogalacturonan acetylesterase [Mitsuaria sp. TWR114]
MKKAWLAALSVMAGVAQAQTQAPAPLPSPPSSLRVILVGDSTMATKSGYGDALCARFQPEVSCLNLAKGGRSTKSFRAEGLWDQVMALLRERREGQADVVLMQFGHNDQPGKPGRSTDLQTEFPANLARYIDDVAPTGARLVMLTPLTRRSFDAQGRLDNALRPWAEATIRVATEHRVPVIDLNAISHAAVQAMGEAEADTLAMAPKPIDAPAQGASSPERAGAANPVFDRTHLGAKGAQVFSAMVAGQLPVAMPELQRWLR